VGSQGQTAKWLRAAHEAATGDDYPLVINARVDVFLWPFLAGAEPGSQADLVPEALRRATAYLEVGVDCVYPIALCERDALRAFLSEVDSPVNVVRLPTGTPPLAELAALGVARVSWGPFLCPQRDGALRRGARRAAGMRGGASRPPRSEC
jgi:2-methylisocitrate lyase-like PEP mutase family enzyme